MELVKIFKFSGLWEAGKKMDAPLGSFQKFLNCYMNKEGAISPITVGDELGNIFPNYFNGDMGPEIEWKYVISSKEFGGNIFQTVFGADLATKEKSYLGFKYTKQDGSEVVSIDCGTNNDTKSQSKTIPVTDYINKKGRGNFSTSYNFNKLFLNYGENKKRYSNQELSDSDKQFGLVRFDGIKLRTAGLPLPKNHIEAAGAAGNHYARTIYVTMSHDGELISSGFRQDQLFSATVSIAHGKDIVTPSTGLSPHPLPLRRSVNDSLFDKDFGSVDNIYNDQFPPNSSNEVKFFDKSFIQLNGTISVDPVTNEFVFGRLLASPEFNEDNTGLGKWLMVDIGGSVSGIDGRFLLVQISSYGKTSGSSVRVSRVKYHSSVTFNWEELDIENYIKIHAIDNPDSFIQFQGTFFNLGKGMTNIWCLVYYSTTATSGYNKCYMFPVFWNSSIKTTGVNLSTSSIESNTLGVISNDLLSWYDDTKSFTRFPPVYGLTQYMGLTVAHDDNAIYFSSTALGGSSEMIDGGTNFTPPSPEFGKITAICGSESFLFISRERKNFVIRGDLINGNFSVIDCDFPCGGAISSNACINSYNDQIIFMTYSGIYSVNSSGSIVEISSAIRSLFLGKNLIAPHPFKKDSLKSLSKVMNDGFDGLHVSMSINESESLLFVTLGLFGNDENTPDGENGTVECSTLVFNLITGAWSEYQGEYKHTGFVSTIDSFFIYGESLRAQDDSGNKEGRNKMSIITSWLSLGEPFIQKQIGRLISYGHKISDVLINVYLDYGARNSEPENVEYDTSAYDSEIKMNTEKACSFAIGLDGHYKIEGIEIETTPIQKTGKRG